MVTEASRNGAKLVVLPEMFTYMGPYERLFEIAEDKDSQLIKELQTLSKVLNIYLVAGSVPERAEKKEISRLGNQKVFNTTYVINPDGEIIGKYRKTHLFTLSAITDQAAYSESDGFIAGDTPLVLSIEGWQIGFAICFDIRFSRLFQAIAEKKWPDALIIPSAFTQKTGEAHWHLLLRARAVEWQAYVIAANQTGEHGVAKRSYGHSVIIDPWGKVLDDTKQAENIAFSVLEKSKLKETRATLNIQACQRFL